MIIILSDFCAGNIYLREVLDCSRKQSFEDFKTFLILLDIYGSGYQKDIHKTNYVERAEKSHAQEAFEELLLVLECLENILILIEDKPLGVFLGS